jgi:hypothetical protein
MDLSTWPAGMRVIVRKERPHPGAQLRITDVDGHRITAFATCLVPGGGRILAETRTTFSLLAVDATDCSHHVDAGKANPRSHARAEPRPRE